MTAHTETPVKLSGKELQFNTAAGRRYLLLRDRRELDKWKTAMLSPEKRTAPRELKRSKLGRERLF
jgi:hypothetical protein